MKLMAANWLVGLLAVCVGASVQVRLGYDGDEMLMCQDGCKPGANFVQETGGEGIGGCPVGVAQVIAAWDGSCGCSGSTCSVDESTCFYQVRWTYEQDGGNGQCRSDDGGITWTCRPFPAGGTLTETLSTAGCGTHAHMRIRQSVNPCPAGGGCDISGGIACVSWAEVWCRGCDFPCPL